MPTVIRERLSEIEVGEPIRRRRVTVIPLIGSDSSPVEYLYLDDALERGRFRVEEKGEGGVVSELLVTNEYERPVLILDGEVLVGGKQNRVINTTVLVAAGGVTTIPVSCVERGRWSRGSRHRPSEYHSPSRIRASLKRTSHRSLRERLSHRSDQCEVWDQVDRVLCRSGSDSPSSDLGRAYEDHSRDLEELNEAIEFPERSVGVLIAVDGRIVTGDVFDRRETLAKYGPRLMRGAAMDVISRGPSSEEDRAGILGEEVARFLDRAGSAPEEEYPAPGLGREIRVEDGDLVGSALALEDRAIHVGIAVGV